MCVSLCLPQLWWLLCSGCCVVLCMLAVCSSVCQTQTRHEWRVYWQRECRPGPAGNWCLAPSVGVDWSQRGFAGVSWGQPRLEASGSFSPSATDAFLKNRSWCTNNNLLITLAASKSLTPTTNIKETVLLLVSKPRSHNNHCGILSHK